MYTVFEWLVSQALRLWNACRNDWGYFGQFIIGVAVLRAVLAIYNGIVNKRKGVQ